MTTKKTAQQTAITLVSAFALILFSNINGAMAGQGETAPGIPATEIVLEQPDISALEHMEGDYFSQCQTLSDKNEEYTAFETNLKTLNTRTFAVVKDLAENNKEIRTAVADISKALAKINSAVIEKDIRRTKKKVLKEMEALKRQLQGTRKSIDKIKKLVNDSQRTVGNTYCQVDQYVNLYLTRAEEAGEQQWEDTALYDTSTAAKMSGKRLKLYNVMVEFDHYFGLLNTLFQHAEHKLALIDSVQKNIVGFVDTHCRDKSAPCRYQQQADLRFNEARLSDIMAKIEEAFSRLILTAQANFSGDKPTNNQEVTHVSQKNNDPAHQ